MNTKAELIKDSIQRIKRLEYALQEEPESEAIKKLLTEEQELLDEIKKSN